MKGRCTVVAFALLVAGSPAFANSLQPAPGTEAGRIKIAQGSVFIVRGGATIPAKLGEVV